MLIEESKEQKSGYIGLVFVYVTGEWEYIMLLWERELGNGKQRVWESLHILFMLLEYVFILMCSLYKF